MGCKPKTEDSSEFILNVNCIVSDYINYRMRKGGCVWSTSPKITVTDNDVLLTVRMICNEFEEKFSKEFHDMCFSCAQIDINVDSLHKIYEELVGEELNWGRVVGILTFSGVMALHCMKSDQANKVDYIVDWTCEFISKRVEPWMREHNGWKGFVEFFKRQTNDRGLKPNWGLLTLGALGVAALGAVLIQRT